MDSQSFTLKGFSEELRYPLMTNRNPLLSPPSSSLEVSPPSEPASPLFHHVPRMEQPQQQLPLHMMYAPSFSAPVYPAEMYQQGFVSPSDDFSAPAAPSPASYVAPLRSHLQYEAPVSSAAAPYSFPHYETDLNQAVANLDESYEAFSNTYAMSSSASSQQPLSMNAMLGMNMNMSQPVFWGTSPSFAQKYPEKDTPTPYYPFSSLAPSVPARSLQQHQLPEYQYQHQHQHQQHQQHQHQNQQPQQRRQWSPLSPPLEGKDDRKSAPATSASNPNTAPSSCIPSPHMSPNIQGGSSVTAGQRPSSTSGSEHDEHEDDEDEEDFEGEHDAGVYRRRGSAGDILSVNDLVKDKNATDFPCMFTDCPKTFKRFEHLKRHLLVHTGEKNYSCSICDKSFSRSDNLVQHTRTHSKQKNLKKLSAEKLLILEQQLQKFEEQGRGIERKSKKNNERKISGPAAMGVGSSFSTAPSSTHSGYGSTKTKSKPTIPKEALEFSFSAKE